MILVAACRCAKARGVPDAKGAAYARCCSADVHDAAGKRDGARRLRGDAQLRRQRSSSTVDLVVPQRPERRREQGLRYQLRPDDRPMSIGHRRLYAVRPGTLQVHRLIGVIVISLSTVEYTSVVSVFHSRQWSD